MKVNQWLAINKNGISRVRKTKPYLEWDEVAIRLQLDIPDDLFRRPIIDATLSVKDVPNNVYEPDIVINTKELIEQQTGAKINFTVIQDDAVDTQKRGEVRANDDPAEASQVEALGEE